MFLCIHRSLLSRSCVNKEKSVTSMSCLYNFGAMEGLSKISEFLVLKVFGYCYNAGYKVVINF